MEKSDIVRFLNERRRNVYNVIVEYYWDAVLSTAPVNLGLELISEDLSKATGKDVKLKYVSLAQAVAKVRGKYPKSNSSMAGSRKTPKEGPVRTNTSSDIGKKKMEFKDLHELENSQQPVKLKID